MKPGTVHFEWRAEYDCGCVHQMVTVGDQAETLLNGSDGYAFESV